MLRWALWVTAPLWCWFLLITGVLLLSACDTNRTGWNSAAHAATMPGVKHSKEGAYPRAWTDYHGTHGTHGDTLLEQLKQKGEIEPCFPNCSSAGLPQRPQSILRH